MFKGDSFEDKKKEIEANKYKDGSIIKRNSLGIKSIHSMELQLLIGVLHLKQLKPIILEHMIYQDA